MCEYLRNGGTDMQVNDLPMVSGVDVKLFSWEDPKKVFYQGMFGEVPVDIRNKEIKYMFPFGDCLDIGVC